jgi:hypothetical protein
MLNQLISILFAVVLTSICPKAYAFGMPGALPLPQTIAQSQIIAFASLTAYYPDVSPTNSTETSSAPIGAVGPSIFTSRPAKPAGRYTFHIIALLKGNSPVVLNVHLPYILSLYYRGSGLSIQTGRKFILFLNTGPDGQLTPTDATTPFVPLADSATLSKDHYSHVEESVYALMLASCEDAKSRETESYLLCTATSPLIVAGLLPYIDDMNLHTRDDVLTCMANNQQVAAIPRIAALNQMMKLGGRVAESATSFSKYQNPEALQYLNPLLFSSDYYMRLNAIDGIDNLANRSSIPYLMLALRDPDYQHIIPPNADTMLYQVIPSFGIEKGSSYFIQHRDAETKRLYAWWSDELLGKHMKPGKHPTIPAIIPDTPALLNPLLFIPDAATRQAVAAKLAQSGNTSSIPYLVLALQDPDTDVAFSAYKTLHRLIPALGSPKSRTDFTASPAAISQPVYDWWRDELLGQHLSK